MITVAPAAGFLLLLGLGFFFGLAFEEFNAQSRQARPGGVRSFPLLALSGALLYRLDTGHLLPVTAGLLVLGGWLSLYYWRHIAETDPEGQPNVGLMTAICNVLAYLLGPIAFTEPPWVAIGVTVVAVLLLTAREKLHGFARQLEVSEIVTAGKFLILTGLVLPFLPNEPITTLMAVTPHQVWLAVVAVCTVSYASYLLQRYVAPREGGLWAAMLGGLYSSTATTVVLARRARSAADFSGQAQTGIILATAIMYLRVLVVVALFNQALALALAPALVTLAAGGLVLAGLHHRVSRAPSDLTPADEGPRNPLELTAALIFAALFVVVTLAATWARSRLGEAGIYALAAIVGFTDIDPFVLSIASGSTASLPTAPAVTAILIATSSNNMLKAVYTAGFAGFHAAAGATAALTLLAVGGVAIAWWVCG
ncbi:MAG TPA: DUF4010 domain-containing protein [Stellaceae bacterium]|nr:DUF4010 domain-containing protein [Stellaceae bacterium]